MWPSDGLFDRTVRPPICSPSPREIVCVRGRQREGGQTDTHLLSAKSQRVKRLCLDSRRTSSISGSAAPRSAFKQRVRGEWRGWEEIAAGQRPVLVLTGCFSHRVRIVTAIYQWTIEAFSFELLEACGLDCCGGISSSYGNKLFVYTQ